MPITLTSIWVFEGEVPESVQASIASRATHVGLAVTLSGLHALLLVSAGVADAVVGRAIGVTVAS